ncbi:hypothetical protein [Microbacterium sp. 18062]|uniref:hypothetical protein n=1 Tax=Microbacterium sp. 18062 TaxID=2681410 RepID=UPI00135CF031|nr:hypothetical protein [Microbacterium sp. 18062]
MSRGQIVVAPDGTEVSLVDIGTTELLDTADVRVWDVSLVPAQLHPWHLHHNPYVVLSIAGGHGRMDWLDGREPRHVVEYTGGAVFRPVSPVHRLTNLSEGDYRNRLVELKALGELRPDGPFDVGAGDRSSPDDAPRDPGPDGRRVVLETSFVTIWSVTVPAGESVSLDLAEVPHVLAQLDAGLEGPELAESVREVPPGTHVLVGSDTDQVWFVVGLTYLADPPHATTGRRTTDD